MRIALTLLSLKDIHKIKASKLCFLMAVILTFMPFMVSAQTSVLYPTYLDVMNVTPAWEDGFTGYGVTVGIIDDSMQLSHPAYASHVSTGLTKNFGYSASEISENPTWSLQGNEDDSTPVYNNCISDGYVYWGDNHGTCVAGCVGAVNTAYNGSDILISGPAYEATRAGVRLNLTQGYLRSSDINNALTTGYNSADLSNSIKIKNNSWGGSNGYAGDTTLQLELLNQSFNNDVIFTYAAGNERDNIYYNGKDTSKKSYTTNPGVITVAATNVNGTNYASFSNYGSSVFVCAPGESIYTSDRSDTVKSDPPVYYGPTGATAASYEGYNTGDWTGTFNGTSAATPLVSGVLAQVVQAARTNAYLDESQINTRLMKHLIAQTATKIEATDSPESAWTQNGAGLTFSPSYGFGMINAAGMCDMVQNIYGLSQLSTASAEWFYNSDTLNNITINTLDSSVILYTLGTTKGYLDSNSTTSGTLKTEYLTNGHGNSVEVINTYGLSDNFQDGNSIQQITPYADDPITNRVTIPDNSSVSIEATFNESAFNTADIMTQNLEEVCITIAASSMSMGDLGITLTSPSGTTSQLAFSDSNTDTEGEDILWTYTSNAFWGENPLAGDGVWTLTLSDAIQNNETIDLLYIASTFYMGNLITSLPSTDVPEPATCLLMCISCFGFIFLRRRKR